MSSCENNGYSHMMESLPSAFQHGVVSQDIYGDFLPLEQGRIFAHGICMYMCQGDELQLVRDALRSLRNSFSGHDPQHHTLNSLEQGVSSLIDRVYSTDSKKRQDRKASM